jgi:hypothetical protein
LAFESVLERIGRTPAGGLRRDKVYLLPPIVGLASPLGKRTCAPLDDEALTLPFKSGVPLEYRRRGWGAAGRLPAGLQPCHQGREDRLDGLIGPDQASAAEAVVPLSLRNRRALVDGGAQEDRVPLLNVEGALLEAASDLAGPQVRTNL